MPCCSGDSGYEVFDEAAITTDSSILDHNLPDGHLLWRGIACQDNVLSGDLYERLVG